MIYLQFSTPGVLQLQNIGLIALPNATYVGNNFVGRNATVSGFGKPSDAGTES